MLWYTGTIALPPVAIYGADRLSDDRYAQAAAYVIDRVTAIAATDSVAFRRQNGSDYDNDLVLRPAACSGLAVHVAG
ncbi:MAG: hypothetical protein AB7J32_24005 [Pseudonocardia sp.]